MSEQKEKTPPIRPLCLALDEARAEIFAVINMTAKKHNLPFYLIESIVNDAARQVGELSAKERENARLEYERQLYEVNNQRGESNE